MQVPLNTSIPVKLDGTGAGTAKIGPIGARESWTPETVSVSASSTTNEALCKIYIGDDTSQRNFVDGTFSGSSGDSTQNVTGPIRLGQYVFALWTGGDAGAIATLTVIGTKDI